MRVNRFSALQPRLSNAGRKPQADRHIWRPDKGRPCAACFATGCKDFIGDLTDTYDRGDCPHCGGSGQIAARERGLTGETSDS